MWLKDLLYNATNEFPDAGRIIAIVCLGVLVGATCWNMHLHKEIKLDDLGTAMGAILTALVVYVYHDRKQNGAG